MHHLDVFALILNWLYSNRLDYLIFETYNVSRIAPAEKIYIHRPEPITFRRNLTDLIERRILWKVENFGYRNNLSANLRIFSAIASATTVIGSLYIVAICSPKTLGVNFSLTAALTGIVSTSFALFWKEKVDIHNKWKYLADLYNNVIQTPPFKYQNETQDYHYRDVLETTLVLDILTMQMWAHDSYYSIFEDVLIDAYLAHAEKPDTQANRDKAKALFLKHGVDEEFASSIISELQSKKIKAAKLAYMTPVVVPLNPAA